MTDAPINPSDVTVYRARTEHRHVQTRSARMPQLLSEDGWRVSARTGGGV